MNKLNMHTQNQVDINIRRIGELFPNALTERKNEKGEVEQAIDFDVLRQELSQVLVEGPQECYQFTWPDKRKAQLLANAPISDTLRPCREESVDFDSTENLYIEGDNLNVLKLLQETYLGKVKMIYIDPPYNTGNDFVYEDDFSQSVDEYVGKSGNYDEENLRMVRNLETNGRYHTDWLNMMYPRLRLAKDLLTDDGVIFISIDDNEVVNLRKICDEVFGERNFVATFVWLSKGSGAYDTKAVNTNHEYVLMYCKDSGSVVVNRQAYDTSVDSAYNQIDERYEIGGKYKRQALSMGTLSYSASLDYPVICPDGTELYPGGSFGPPYAWRYSKAKMEKALSEGFAEIVKTRNGWSVYSKQYERIDENGKQIERDKPYTTFGIDALNRRGTQEIKAIFGNGVFDYPKPNDLIIHLLRIATINSEIVLDFFSGSATTAHAVMQLNAEDGGKRKFIMVQLPEETDEKSEAYKAGYKNICEIGKERIRRAGAKIKEELQQQNQQLKLGEEPKELPDTGFRVLKLASSNMKDVYYAPQDYTQARIDDLIDNIKEGRTPQDLLFQVMLELGVLLSSPISESDVNGQKVFSVADGFLMACFDSNIKEDTITHIAKQKTHYAVFRDSGYATDSVAVNFEQIFKAYSPDTVRRVL